MTANYNAKTDKRSEEGDSILERIKRCYKLVVDVETQQRRREKEDLQFQVGDLQWDEAARAERNGGMGQAGQVVPPRPMLSISLLSQPQQLILNQAQQADLAVQIHPVSEDADDEAAEVRQGLYRRIERDSHAPQARLWALDRAIQCGRGWYRVETCYDEDSDDPFDQEIVIKRMLRQELVYMDPAAQERDFSDAEWCIVAAWMPHDDFVRKYPKAKIPSGQMDFEDSVTRAPGWVRQKDGKSDVLVAEYFHKEYDTRKVESGEGKDKRTREVKDCRLMWVKVCGGGDDPSGLQELEPEQQWNGKHIPLIPVIGRELQPFDDERRFEGIVRPARDGQKMFNASASTVVERMMMEPKVPFVMANGQQEGFEAQWQQANRRNMPYLLYNPTSAAGQTLPPPQRAQIDQSGTSLAMMGLEQARHLVQTATFVYDPGLGKDDRQKSGRSILALQQQGDAGTSHYIQNLATVSMPYEAKVVLDMMPYVYDRPGRITSILHGEKDEPKFVMLNAPFMRDEMGQPAPVPDVDDMGNPMEPPEEAEHYDLSKGKYSISVTVGRAYQTRLEEGRDAIGQILQARPELMPVIGDIWFRFTDFPGHQAVAERVEKWSKHELPWLHEEEGQQPSADQLQAQVAQMQQIIEQGKAMMAELAKKAEGNELKAQTTLAKTEMDNQTKIKIAALDAQTELAISAQKADAENARTKADAHQAMMQRGHEKDLAVHEAAHEVGMEHEKANLVQIAPLDLNWKGENKEPLEKE